MDAGQDHLDRDEEPPGVVDDQGDHGREHAQQEELLDDRRAVCLEDQVEHCDSGESRSGNRR